MCGTFHCANVKCHGIVVDVVAAVIARTSYHRWLCIFNSIVIWFFPHICCCLFIRLAPYSRSEFAVWAQSIELFRNNKTFMCQVSAPSICSIPSSALRVQNKLMAKVVHEGTRAQVCSSFEHFCIFRPKILSCVHTMAAFSSRGSKHLQKKLFLSFHSAHSEVHSSCWKREILITQETQMKETKKEELFCFKRIVEKRLEILHHHHVFYVRNVNIYSAVAAAPAVAAAVDVAAAAAAAVVSVASVVALSRSCACDWNETNLCEQHPPISFSILLVSSDWFCVHNQWQTCWVGIRFVYNTSISARMRHTFGVMTVWVRKKSQCAVAVCVARSSVCVRRKGRGVCVCVCGMWWFRYFLSVSWSLSVHMNFLAACGSMPSTPENTFLSADYEYVPNRRISNEYRLQLSEHAIQFIS